MARWRKQSTTKKPEAKKVHSRGKFLALQDKLLISTAAVVVATAMGIVLQSTSHVVRYLTRSTTDGVLTIDELRAVEPELLRYVGGGAMAVVAVMLPLLFVLVHRAYRPISRLAKAARNVAAGEFTTVDIRRSDALGTLADAYNDMVLQLSQQKGRTDDVEQQLRKSNASLEKKVAQRTAEIEAATTRLSSEISEKEDFLRAVSHDLNAPLRNIDGMVTMLLRKHQTSLPEEVIQRLDRIKHNVRVETDLIQELLDLSRIKSQREMMENVNVQDLVEELRLTFDNDLRDHGIDLIIETRLPIIRGERNRIRQVLQNLIDNAIKYMGSSIEPQIRVGCLLKRDEAEFYVRDTGIGIKPEDMEKVFYVFRRGSNHGQVGGKGVGLASVKSIVEMYLGTIWVESRPGSGSTFRFTINGSFLQSSRGMFQTHPDAHADADAEKAAETRKPLIAQAGAEPETAEPEPMLEPETMTAEAEVSESESDSIPLEPTWRTDPIPLEPEMAVTPAFDGTLDPTEDAADAGIDASADPDADGLLDLPEPIAEMHAGSDTEETASDTEETASLPLGFASALAEYEKVASSAKASEDDSSEDPVAEQANEVAAESADASMAISAVAEDSSDPEDTDDTEDMDGSMDAGPIPLCDESRDDSEHDSTHEGERAA